MKSEYLQNMFLTTLRFFFAVVLLKEFKVYQYDSMQHKGGQAS